VGVGQQRDTFRSVNGRLERVQEAFPSIGQVMGKIRLRRNKETVLLGVVVGILLALTYVLFRQ